MSDTEYALRNAWFLLGPDQWWSIPWLVVGVLAFTALVVLGVCAVVQHVRDGNWRGVLLGPVVGVLLWWLCER